MYTKRVTPVKPRPNTHPRTQLCQTGAGQQCFTLPAPCYSAPISTIDVTWQLSVTIALGTCMHTSIKEDRRRRATRQAPAHGLHLIKTGPKAAPLCRGPNSGCLKIPISLPVPTTCLQLHHAAHQPADPPAPPPPLTSPRRDLLQAGITQDFLRPRASNAPRAATLSLSRSAREVPTCSFRSGCCQEFDVIMR